MSTTDGPLNTKQSNFLSVGGKKFRFCAICRGDDLPFIRCNTCSKPFHFECAAVPFDQRFEPNTTIIRKDWMCVFCTEVDDDSEVEDKLILSKDERKMAQDLKKRLHFCKDSANKLCQARKHFISDHRSLLEPFCDDALLNKLSAVNNKHEAENEVISCSSKITDLVCVEDNIGFLKQSPSYITVPVRDYQLEGINKMYDWYLRGVGGILADEM